MTHSVSVQDWKPLVCSENKRLPLPALVHTAPICWWVSLILWSVPWNTPSEQKKKKKNAKPPWKRTTTETATEPPLCERSAASPGSSLRPKPLATITPNSVERNHGCWLDLVVTFLINLALHPYAEIAEPNWHLSIAWSLPPSGQAIGAAAGWINVATGGQWTYLQRRGREERSPASFKIE